MEEQKHIEAIREIAKKLLATGFKQRFFHTSAEISAKISEKNRTTEIEIQGRWIQEVFLLSLITKQLFKEMKKHDEISSDKEAKELIIRAFKYGLNNADSNDEDNSKYLSNFIDEQASIVEKHCFEENEDKVKC